MTIDEIFEVWEHQPFSDLDDLKATVTAIVEELEKERDEARKEVSHLKYRLEQATKGRV